MKFKETKLKDATIIEIEPIGDNRGYFAVGFNQDEFERHGLQGKFVQVNLSFNKTKGTVRGLHARQQEFEEEKLIRVTQGAVYDVIVDIRPDSDTYGQWVGVELNAENNTMVYVPKGFLHGFQTLTDDTLVQYQVSDNYRPNVEIGARYDDPAFKIDWPLAVTEISDKDQAWDNFKLNQTV